MISWENYLNEFVDSYRTLNEKIPLDLLEAFHKKLSVSYIKPCQIEVVELIPNRNIWLIIYDKNHEDKAFYVSKIEKSEAQTFAKGLTEKYPSLKRKATKISKYLRKKFKSEDIGSKRLHEDICEGLGAIYANFDVRAIDPRLRAGDIFDYGLKAAKDYVEKEKLKDTTKQLKRQITKVSEENIRSELLKTLKRLDEQQDALSVFSEEINGFRKLVGSTREFQDWKAWLADIEHLKGTHVAKEVFDAKIEGLDKKIERGLENLEKRWNEGAKALNTRIEDLQAIKFWSKRTVLEIALVIWGTIVSLIAAGIIKF